MNAQSLCAMLQAEPPYLFECSDAPRGAIRVRTPFMYPDGGYIDVYALERDGVLQITDFGDSLGWLRLQKPKVTLSTRQRRLIEDVALTLGVEFFKGQLALRVGPSDVSKGVLRVAQAALRVSDLWFTLRAGTIETAADQVEEWLTERGLPFERSVTLSGRSGRTWNVDFEIRAPRRTSLVHLLSTGSRAAARRVTEHVVAALYDLNHLKVVTPQLAFISLFDDTEDVWQEEDFRLVQELSIVARWSRPDELERFLLAA